MVGNLLVDAVIIATVGSSILVEVDLAVLVLVAIAGQFVFNVDGFLVGFGQVLAGHIDDPVALVTLDGVPTELGDVLGQAVLGFANADTLAGQLSAGAGLLVVDFQLHVAALAGLLGLQLGGQGAFNVVTTLEFLVEGTFDGLLIRDNLAVTAFGAILVHQLEVLRCIDLEFCRVLDGELLPVLDPVFGLPLGVEGGVIPHGQGLVGATPGVIRDLEFGDGDVGVVGGILCVCRGSYQATKEDRNTSYQCSCCPPHRYRFVHMQFLPYF